MQDPKPTTHQGDLTKLPRALEQLTERPQWTGWRWTLKNGRWQKPPFMATAPERHASTKDPDTWCDYATALAAVQAGKVDGISYVLTAADPFAAIDLDHCRHAGTHSIDVWAQNFLDVTRHTYAEVTPSGEGCRIWGLTAGDSAPVNRKFTLEIDGKEIAAELFRRTPKALTITAYRLDTVRELTNIDKAFHWAIVWGERRQAAAAEAAETARLNGHEFNGSGSGHDIERIEQIVREGPLGGNRSDTFHTVVGHYLGCDWSIEQIYEHMQQFPDGIADKYISEGRLRQEINRSAAKHAKRTLPLIEGWKAPEPKPVPPAPKPPPPDPADDDADDSEELEPLLDPDDDLDDEPEQAPLQPKTPPPQPDPADDPELEDPPPQPDPELEDDELEDDEQDDELGEDDDQPDPNLPRLYKDWEPDPDPPVTWLIKHLVPSCGFGLLSGQWGTYKTFVVLDLLLASIGTGQPFLGHMVKRQCGALLIAAEGANQVRVRRNAVVREKCGDVKHLPFCWYKQTPLLLQKGATKELIAMARQADKSLQAEFGLPLGLIIIDTITSCAGYPQAGGENDGATGQAIMDVLKAVAEACNCFVLGVAHFGKNVEAGTSGTAVKENASDLILACLGEKQLNGSVTNTRLAVRKNKGGPQGQEYPFTMRLVETPEPDQDGDPITSLVVDWQPAGAPGGTGGGTKPGPDPWDTGTASQRAASQRLKRVLMSALAEHGVELSIPPDGPMVRMIKQKTVRKLFYDCTPTDDDDESDQTTDAQRKQFNRARDRADVQGLIACHKIEGVDYLRLRGREGADE